MLTRHADTDERQTPAGLLADVPARRPRTQAGWLSGDPDPSFVVVHRAADPVRDTAVLMCPPFGWEEARSYRPWRAAARGLSDAGFPTARLSIPGTGNSGGLPTDPDRLTAWIAAVADAARWLRAHSGCARVAAFGVGLGGALAIAALSEGAPIDDLALWAVPAAGRRLVREMRAYAAIAAVEEATRLDADGQPVQTVVAPPEGREGDLELTGHVLSAETVAALGKLNLVTLPVEDAAERRVLMLDRSGTGVDEKLKARFETLGASVSVRDGGSYDAMMAPPQLAVLPEQLVPTLTGWLQESPAGAPAQPEPQSSAPGPLGVIDLDADGATIRETTLSFEAGPGRGFAILSEPVSRAPEPVWAVVLNAGALSHVGPNRMTVELARRWARRGVPVVRVDLEGIGDADGDAAQHVENGGLYDEKLITQTLALLDQLDGRGGPGRYILAGTCSGAWQALHGGARDPRVRGVLTVNLSVFHWSEQLATERHVTQHRRAIRAAARRRLRERDLSWRQVKTAVREFRGGTFRPETRTAESSQLDTAVDLFDRLRAQDTETLLLLSESEPTHETLDQLELTRWPNLMVEPVPSRDHLYRALRVQHAVHDGLDRGLDRTLARLGARLQEDRADHSNLREP